MPQRKRYTPDQIQAIDAALVDSCGYIPSAADKLGVPSRRLKEIVRNNPILRAKWKGKGGQQAISQTEVPEAGSVMNRELVIEDSDIKAMEALDKEDKSFKLGLEMIGITGERKAMVQGMQKFYGVLFAKTLEMTGGGINKQFLDVMLDLDAIRAKLNDDSPKDLKTEQMLREDRRGLLDLSIRMFNCLNRAALTRALIKEKSVNGANGKSKKPPGFLAIQAQAGSTVNVQTKDQGGEGEQQDAD